MATHENWKEFNTLEMIEKIDKQWQESHDPFLIELAKAMKMPSPPDEPFNCHIKATPLFELSSVKIPIPRAEFEKLNAGYGTSSSLYLEYYGHIQLIDDNGNKLDLFKRHRRDAVTVLLPKHCDILEFQKRQLGSPHLLPKSFLLKLYLKDKHRDTVIINAQKLFNFTHDVTYDKKQDIELICSNPDRVIYVGYTIFQCAVIASVYVAISGSDQCAFSVVPLLASINTRDRPNSYTPHEFFVKPPRSEFEAAVAVPANSSLEIQWGGDEQIFRSPLKFEASDTFEQVEKELVGRNYHILVRVTWRHAFCLFRESFVPERRDAEGSSGEESEEFSECGENSVVECKKLNTEERADISDREKSSIEKSQEKRILRSKIKKQKSRLLSSQSLSHVSNQSKSRILYSQSEQLVEVFSVSICSYDDDGALTSVYGTINCSAFKNFVIFNGVEDILHNRDTLPLEQPDCCYVGPYFVMNLDLKDAKGREISRGYVSLCEHTATGWYDRRICSVVQGKYGFAAVHYTIFGNAVQAKLKVFFKSNSDAVCQVHGSICATYSNYRYSTHHDKKYYQSTLFDVTKNKKGKSEFVLLRDGDEVLLSKSVVSVPVIASLIVKADLRVLVAGKYEKLRGMAKLKAELPEFGKLLKSPICELLKSPNCELSVSVVWG